MSSVVEKLSAKLANHSFDPLPVMKFATVIRVTGLLIEARGAPVAVGDICWLLTSAGEVPCEAVGFDLECGFFMPLKPCVGIRPGSLIRVASRGTELLATPKLEKMLGRVVNGLGQPIDGGPDIETTHTSAVAESINPMQRHPIDTTLDMGVRSINALLTVGRGQRLGLFAGSGVGKSVLLGMLARMVKADVVVVGLIGERGREVQEFVNENLGDGLAKSVVVACPADDSAALRIRGAQLATEVAERFRDQGLNVLLLMDSLTRVAQAQREIGLALGEPPSSKGYTPSSFAILPKLVERAGTGKTKDSGSVTAIYTVLMEEDDLQDPVVDSARAILDGHVVLSREMAEQGIFPAVDIGSSISRLMSKLNMSGENAVKFRHLWQSYREQQDLINIGAYQPGSDPTIDQAIRLYPKLCDFIRQDQHQAISFQDSLTSLSALFDEVPVEAN